MGNGGRITMQLKEVTMDSKEIIEPYYKRADSRDCEYSFANNWLWAPHYQMKYGITNGMLVFFETLEGVTSASFPIGLTESDDNLKAAIEQLKMEFGDKGIPFILHRVSREQYSKLNELYPDQFRIQFDEGDSDYVYDREKLATLTGKKFHSKRNFINRFMEEYPDYSFEELGDDNWMECLQMAHEWRGESGCADDPEKCAELCVALRALKYRKELGLHGGILRVKGKIVAFTVGEPLNSDTYVVHIEKAFADVPGAYPMINREFVEHAMQEFTYVNREEDLGVEGLRKAKQSYHPVIMVEKGTVTI